MQGFWYKSACSRTGFSEWATFTWLILSVTQSGKLSVCRCHSPSLFSDSFCFKLSLLSVSSNIICSLLSMRITVRHLPHLNPQSFDIWAHAIFEYYTNNWLDTVNLLYWIILQIYALSINKIDKKVSLRTAVNAVAAWISI